MNISNNEEPTEEQIEEQIEEHMKNNNENYYCSREKLRELNYGGKPPNGYSDWGTYWKTF